MEDNKDFFAMTAADELQFVKHNPTDYESFKDFHKDLSERFSKIEKTREKESIIANLKKWEDSLPDRWKDASLPKIKSEASEKAAEIISEKGISSFFLEGQSGAGKTYLAYGILRRYIGLNHVTPSKIKIISEEALMGLTSLGFDGKKRIDELFAHRYSVYLFDNVASKGEYKEWEKQLWEQLIDHIYTKDLTAIFTSTKRHEDFAVRLSDSGDSKFRHLISNNIIKVKSKNTPKILEEDTSLDEDILDNFK